MMFRFFPLCMILTLMPGCAWNALWQSQCTVRCYYDVDSYIRSYRMYQDFASTISTVVLWCSPEVTALHDQLYYERTGCTFNGKHPHAFVLLMPYSDDIQLQTDYRLGQWAVTLEYNDQVVAPQTVYRSRLDPEYQYLLGQYYNQFYTVYAVAFNQAPQIPFMITLRSATDTITMAWSTC